MNQAFPPFAVYHGYITAVSGTEGDCIGATFSAEGHASWDPKNLIKVTGVKMYNPLSCDVPNKLPVQGDLCDIRIKRDGTPVLCLLTHSIIFKDC